MVFKPYLSASILLKVDTINPKHIHASRLEVSQYTDTDNNRDIINKIIAIVIIDHGQQN